MATKAKSKAKRPSGKSKAKRPSQITIKFATLNETPVTRSIPVGSTIEKFTSELGVSEDAIFVNSKRVSSDYILRNDDFVVVVTRIAAG